MSIAARLRPSLRLPLRLSLLLLPLLLPYSAGKVMPVLRGTSHGYSTLASPSADSCAQCGVLCALMTNCSAVSCSDLAAAGLCRLLESPLPFCDTNWTEFAASCYRLGTEKTEWATAKTACPSLRSGSQLASIHSQEENDFIAAVLLAKQGAFIGLEHNASASGTRDFRWLDGTPLDFEHWNETQPNDSPAKQLCVVAERVGALWMDYWVEDSNANYTHLCKYTP